jgi:asparaginyl-tRNA synthetase
MFRVSTLDISNLPRTVDGQVDFSQDFFGKETYLTVSGQLELETYCCAMSRVYTFGPTFRAENSNTSRHLAEFWMVEPELAFASLAEDADLAERFLKTVFSDVLSECEDELRYFQAQVDAECISKLERFVTARLEYTESILRLEAAVAAGHSFEFPVSWGMDLQSEHERYLTEVIIQRPVVLMNYPREIKAFYMRLNDDGRTVAAMDVLAPGVGEIIGGGQREERLNVLDQRMSDLNLDKHRYNWYRDLRRYGTVPHAGFGLGLERTLSYITGLSNVRDVIAFPRTPRSAEF